MKYFYKFLSVVALVAVLLTGCAKEQSSFSAEDIPGRATIMGSYYYDAGVEYDEELGEYVAIVKPLAGHVVFVQIDNSTLKSGAKGDTVYETVTNAQGEYAISIPVTLDGTDVQVYPKPFMAEYSEVVGADEDGAVIKTPDAVYTSPKESFKDVCPYDIKFHDAICTPESKRQEAETYPYTWTFTVTVGEAQYSKSSSTIKKEYTSPDDVVSVLVKVKDSKTDKEVYYAARTNRNSGVAKFIVPAAEADGSATVTAIIKPYLKNNYKYYYYNGGNITSQSISAGSFEMYNGYSVASSISNSLTFKDLEGVPAPDLRVRMVFVPFSNVESFGYSVGEWYGIEF